MIRFAVESSSLVAARTVFGDEAVAEFVFSQEYDPEFVSRHSHQLAGLLEALVDE